MVTPRVTVLVLNYNARATLEECLLSLRETTYPNAHLVVLDNGSTDGSAEIAQRMGVETRLYGENLGYCSAYNRAFQEFSEESDYLLMSNEDLIVPPPTIGNMVAVAEEDEGIGFVGPVQLHSDTRDVRSAGIRWACGRLPWNVKEPGQPIDYIEGAFVLVRREVLSRVGELDEDFAIDLNDVEWQARAAKAGFRSVVDPEALIFHHRPKEKRVASGAYYSTRNACILTEKYCGRGGLLRLKARLYTEGILSSLLGRPRGEYILEGLRDFRRGVRGMRAFT